MCNCLVKVNGKLYIENGKVVGYEIDGVEGIVGRKTKNFVTIDHCLLNDLRFSIEVSQIDEERFREDFERRFFTI